MSRTTFTEQTRAARAVCDKSTVIDCREMVPGFEDDAGEKACSKQVPFFLCRGFGREVSVTAQCAEEGLWPALQGCKRDV